jgi:glycogen phosphorylase
MTDVVQSPDTTPHERSRTGLSADALRRGILDHLCYSIGRPAAALNPEHYYRATALAVRDRMQDNRAASTQTSLDLGRKVTCYLSAEFLMGPQLGSNLLNLGIEDEVRAALHELGQDLDVVPACEEETGTGQRRFGTAGRVLPRLARHSRAPSHRLWHPLRVRHLRSGDPRRLAG